jgi:serine/threonine-protein kinase
MGVVLEADDEPLDRRVAVKFIRSSAMDDTFRARFKAEAQAMARVSHPNVLQIYASGEYDGTPYFVMEYVDGVSLDQWLVNNGGPPELGLGLQMMQQICAGVAAIHAADTVHRDLKPSNVLVDVRGRARVADLGLAVLRDEEPARREIVGTPTYMAPEVAFPSDGDESMRQRSDVYSLGCIAYELLTGLPPFVANGHRAMMFQHATTAPTAPSVRRPALPPMLDGPVLRALAKRPSDRTPTVDAFAEELRVARVGIANPVRILVAEDNDDFRGALELALEISFPDAVLECVADGDEALAAFDRKRPSVVILDLLMPGLDGLQLTGLIRARDPSATVPIIVLTASGGPAEWKRLAAIGADRFLVKPVELDDVVAMVQHLVRERSVSLRPPDGLPSNLPLMKRDYFGVSLSSVGSSPPISLK